MGFENVKDQTVTKRRRISQTNSWKLRILAKKTPIGSQMRLQAPKHCYHHCHYHYNIIIIIIESSLLLLSSLQSLTLSLLLLLLIIFHCNLDLYIDAFNLILSSILGNYFVCVQGVYVFFKLTENVFVPNLIF